MNICTVIARKGNKFESLAISEDARSIKEGFKQIDETSGFDAVYLIDSRSGAVRVKKFNRETAPVKEKKTRKEKAPVEPAAAEPEATESDAPDFGSDAEPGLLDGIE